MAMKFTPKQKINMEAQSGAKKRRDGFKEGSPDYLKWDKRYKQLSGEMGAFDQGKDRERRKAAKDAAAEKILKDETGQDRMIDQETEAEKAAKKKKEEEEAKKKKGK